ncbi:MAG: photosynthetic complex putative assembly protein PuhB [Minwuia sp.]|uniref:photosynthetic complex putative assembly protein PuhB n=1 Tax=Minwuia sp. TaxID=2493630 RepID=UPI003A8600D0
MREHDDEPVPGLPGRLPEGEHIVWQGRPDWRAMARRTFHVRVVAIYFALLIAWGLASALADGGGVAAGAASLATLLPMTAAGLGLLVLLAWLNARTTVYTITNRRVVMRFGVALQMAVNYPFAKIGGAALREYPDGTGDIVLTTTGNDKLAYLHLWPHARPWRFRKPEPMLRTVPDAAKAAELLSTALQGGATSAAPAMADTRPTRPARSAGGLAAASR